MIGKILTISAAILTLSSVNASSQTVLSVGGQTCDKWADVHVSTSSESAALDNWVHGYVAGKAAVIEADNRTKGLPPTKVLRGLDAATVVRLTGEYCRGNPLRTVAQAADELSAQAVADGSTPALVTRPSRVKIVTNRPAAETTGSGDITGSVKPFHECERIAVVDSSETAVREFRKCE